MRSKNVNYNKNVNPIIEIDKGYSSDMTIVTIGNLKLYFSYSTIVAFEDRGELFISENIWSMTTGKHLNWISPHKDLRMEYNEFEKELIKVLEEKNLVEGVISDETC